MIRSTILAIALLASEPESCSATVDVRLPDGATLTYEAAPSDAGALDATVADASQPADAAPDVALPDAATDAHDAGTCAIPSGRLVAAGDSLTAGTGQAGEDPYPTQLSRMIGRTVENQGRGFAHVLNPNTVNSYPSIPDLTGTPGIVLFRGGTNDLRIAKQTAEQTSSSIDAWVARQRANGWRVIVQPIWRAGGNTTATYDIHRMRINDHILVTYGGESLEHDDKMGDAYDPYTNTHYIDDGLHPNNLGHRHQAEYAMRALAVCP